MASSLNFLSRPETAGAPARRVSAWLLPAGILAGFGVLFGVIYRDRLLPAPAVKVAPVLATADAAPAPGSAGAPAANNNTGGATLFQASGWIEPEPYSVKASALIDGVVATVHVLEGQDVEKGQPLVSLIDDDAKLALTSAGRRHQLLVSGRTAHLSAIEAMGRKREAARLEADAAKAMHEEAEDQLARSGRLVKTSAVSQADFISARLRVQKEKSLYQAAMAKEAEIVADVQRTELEAKAKEDEIAVAAVAVDQARLALERTRIPAPITGRVLRLLAAPGDKKMLGMDHPDSSTVCVLYDPHKLQVRVDVPLADAAGLSQGQRTRIHTGLLSGRVFDGEVIRITGEADVQRNTLQVKVRLLNPADQLRPEMLCRVEFLGAAGPSSAPGIATGTALALWVPAEALRGDTVWVCDPETKRLTRRTVKTAEKKDHHVRVIEGVRPGEQAVLTAGDWDDGQRVNPQPATP